MSNASYTKMTEQEFDAILAEIVSNMSAAQILAIGDVYATLREEFNNEVLSKWEERFPEKAFDTTIPCTFISVWEEGDIVTAAKVNLGTGEVIDVETSSEGEDFESLSHQCIEVGGIRYDISEERWNSDGTLFLEACELENLRNA